MFQKKILNKYLTNIDEIEVSKAFANLEDFRNSIENIRKSKEEQYQSGFLNDFFVKSLGYVLFPNSGFNLTTELKNESNSKKSDGAILNSENKPIAVIELKSTKIKSLDKITDQAFIYKNNHPTCKYVITSNFHKLRFYIEFSNEFIEFNLFDLSLNEFKKLYLLLNRDSILSDLPKKIRDESKQNQDSIADEFYKKYSDLRLKLFENIANENQNITKIDALNFSQKILDRFIFIFFAEDKAIIDTKTTQNLVSIFQNDWEKRELYHFVKLIFNAVDVGNERLNISAYNGGLFKLDENLDSLKIDDEVLLDILKLANYDFDSEIDVNILGHIFENSLDDLEQIREDLFGDKFDINRAKRKKDGIFYTPSYITNYIVKNTVGVICENKKSELKIDNCDLERKLTKSDFDKFTQYKEFLQKLKILDPAVGSGAFLNQAFNFLLQEYQFVYEVLNRYAQQKKNLLLYEEIDILILENNLFGVDINDEAVEIAKLSLWLKTAKNGRKLTNLNNNIKVGNSLIDDENIDKKAFNWKKEFSEIFENGGFDIVIGNPPYGAKLDENSKKIFKNKYPLIDAKTKDSYLYFVLLAFDLLKENSTLGLIIPNSWLLINTAKQFREYLLQYKIRNLIDYGDGVFEDATVESLTIILDKKIDLNSKVSVKKLFHNQEILNNKINKSNWLKDDFKRIIFEKNDILCEIKKKALINSVTKFEQIAEIVWGIKPYQVGYGIPKQTREIVKNRIYHSMNNENQDLKKLLIGKNIDSYQLEFTNNYIQYGDNLAYKSNETKMINPKLLMRQTSDKLRVTYDKNSFYCQNSIFIITSKSEQINLLYLMSLLNSNFLNFLYKLENPQNKKIFAEIKPSVIKSLPIPKISEKEQQPFIEKADLMLQLNQEYSKIKKEFLDEIKSYYNLEKLNKKLEIFYTLKFDEFVKEISKVAKLKLKTAKDTKELKNYWFDLFEEESQKLIKIKSKIDSTDNEIDKMVYKLYGLNSDEVRIIKN